jgi:hypothetical protein
MSNPFSMPPTDPSLPHSPAQPVSNSSMTAKRIAKWALAVFVLSALVVTTAALCMRYPSAPTFCYAVAGSLAGVSLIIFALASSRLCLQRS